MENLQQSLCRCVVSRNFLQDIREAAGDDVDELDASDPNESPLSRLGVTEHGINLLLEGLADDQTAEELFRTLVEGRQVCVGWFWAKFPGTLLTWARCCRWQNVLRHVAMDHLDGTTRRMLRRINRDTNTEQARRLVSLDPTRLARRIDDATGVPHANIIMIYTVAFVLRRDRRLWQEFQKLLADLKPGRRRRPGARRTS